MRAPKVAQMRPSDRKLDQVLVHSSNNFDLLRLLLAFMVIYGHTPAFYSNKKWFDPFTWLLGSSYAGHLAVSVFFLLSGLFVTESIRRSNSVLDFSIRRFLRIYPGLLLCLMFTVFFVGSAFTSLSLFDYFRNPSTWSYLTNNLRLSNDMQWHLPGVFSDSKHGVNGSLWTLPGEVRLYVCVAFIFALGALDRTFSALIAIGLVTYGFVHQMFPGFAVSQALGEHALLFGLGASFSILKRFIPLSLVASIAIVTLAYALRPYSIYPFFAEAAFAFACLYVFSRPWVNRLRLPGDYSYGVYLYGFPIQQVVAHSFPDTPLFIGMLTSCALAFLLAMLSWHFCEKPANNLGRTTSEWATSNGRLLKSFFCRSQMRQVVFGLAASAFIVSVGYVAFLTKSLPEESFIRITNYGPESVQHGEGFNVQADGSSAIWVMVSRRLSPDAVLTIDGLELSSIPQGNLITAIVPREAFKVPGTFKLRVAERYSGGGQLLSAPVNWTVQ